MKSNFKVNDEMINILLHQSLMGTAIIQEDKLLFINKNGEEITGYSEEEMREMSGNIFMSMIHPDDVELVIEQKKSSLMIQI